MATIIIRDNALWAKHLPDALSMMVEALEPGDPIRLEIDGIVGIWKRMSDGKDGRPTLGLKPIDAMRELWNKWQDRRGEAVQIRLVDDEDSYLAAVSNTLAEWTSAEDELAYGNL